MIPAFAFRLRMILRAASTCLGGRIGNLVQDIHTRELDLVGQKVNEGTLISLAQGLSPVVQKVVTGVVVEKVNRVYNSYHGVELRNVLRTFSVDVA